MQTEFAYHFLQSLSFALVNSLWQMALLWFIFNLLQSMLRLKPVNNFRLLIFLQIGGFAWMVITLVNALLSNNGNQGFTQAFIPSSVVLDKIFPLIAILYLFFITVFLVRYCIQFLGLNELRQNEIKSISADWENFVANAATALQIKAKVNIRISKTITTPFTIGFLKPVILIPLSSINYLSPQQMEAVLLHELAHIKRQDYVLNLFLLVIDALMFFNPFAKLFYQRINVERELCCDDVVICRNYSPKLYAQALLNIAKSQTQVQSVFGMAAVSAQQHLLDRVKRILNIETKKPAPALINKHALASLAFGLVLFFLIGFIDVNVKEVVSEKMPLVEEIATPIVKTTPVVYKKEPTKISSVNKAVAKNSSIKKKGLLPLLDEQNLVSKRQKLEQSLQLLGKLATENADISVVSNNETESTDEKADNEVKDISIAPAIEKHATTTTQRFFIPATSKKPASVIVVTTTEKENGKKVVKIEIENGSSKAE